MALIKCRPIPHPIYEVYESRSMHDSVKLFRIKLYLIFADGRVFTMFNQSDWIDNVNLMRESGTHCSTFTHDLIVSPTHHSDLFNDILQYVP